MMENPYYHQEEENELTILPPLFWVAVIFIAFGMLAGCASTERDAEVCYVKRMGETDGGLIVILQKCMSPEAFQGALE